MGTNQVVSIHYATPLLAPVIQQWNGQRWEAALNNRELGEAALAEIAPLVEKRWRAYWEMVIARGTIALASTKATDLMGQVRVPSPEYPCSEELLSRAVFPTASESSAPVLVMDEPPSLSKRG